MLKAIPLTLLDANEYVRAFHRHHAPIYRDKFRIGCVDTDRDTMVGVIQVGRPVSRILDDGHTLEVVRLCTDGTKDVCSFLYSRAARISKELGYCKIIPYILNSESGVSLKAAGWTFEAYTSGGSWNRTKRPRDTSAPTVPKQRWGKVL